MSIANRIGALLALAALVLLGVDAIVLKVMVLPSFDRLDEADARGQIRLVRGEISAEMAVLERFAADWGGWDDAYHFAKDRNQAFISANLETRVMQEQGLSLMWYVDLDGRTLWGRAFDPSQALPKPHPSYPGQMAPPDSALIRFKDLDSSYSGIVETPLGPMIVASHPVVTSHFQGPARGFFIAGKLLDDKRWQQIGERIGAHIAGLSTAQLAPDSPGAGLLAKLAPGSVLLDTDPNGARMHAYAALHDDRGRPVALISSTLDRLHYELGKETLRTALLVINAGVLMLMGLVYLALRRYVSRPLLHLAEDIKSVSEAPGEARVSGLARQSQGEVAVVSREVAGMMERLAYLSNTDTLTGLPNRAAFHEKARHALALAKRHQTRFAILLLDLDGFKQVNDTLGHEAGDRLLIALSKALKAVLRESDSLGRFGGDEFLILVESLPSATGAAELARRVLDIFKEPLIPEDVRHGRGCSIGVAIYPDDAKSIEELLRMADIAMYRAKSSGGNTWRCHAESLECRHEHEKLGQEAEIEKGPGD